MNRKRIFQTGYLLRMKGSFISKSTPVVWGRTTYPEMETNLEGGRVVRGTLLDLKERRSLFSKKQSRWQAPIPVHTLAARLSNPKGKAKRSRSLQNSHVERLRKREAKDPLSILRKDPPHPEECNSCTVCTPLLKREPLFSNIQYLSLEWAPSIHRISA